MIGLSKILSRDWVTSAFVNTLELEKKMVQTPSDNSGTKQKKQQLGNVDNMQIDDTQLQVSNNVTNDTSSMVDDTSVAASEQSSSTNNQQSTTNNSQPSIQQQKQMIQQFENTKLKVGDSWYLIEQKWFDAWTTYVGYYVDQDVDQPQGPFPGSIDNSPLVLSCTSGSNIYKLQRNLIEKVHYTLVHENAGKLLFSWWVL
jgi:hypothetical protein